MSTPKFRIEDWAGNICFQGRTFDTLEDADTYLSEQFEHLSEAEYEEERGEYWIIEIPTPSKTQKE